MKTFKTYDEQVEILKSRRLIIKDELIAKKILKTENYYFLINGYKDIFLDESSSEAYKEEASLSEIYALYQFDRELRHLFLKYLLKFETCFKSIISYQFSNHFPVHSAYLNPNNYNQNPIKTEMIEDLNKLINKKSNHNGPIKHYMNHYRHVPFWILTKFMTFGQVNKMYYCLNTSLQNAISKEFSNLYREDYQQAIRIFPRDLETISRVINFFRNLCAHEERLYNFALERRPHVLTIAQTVGIEPINIEKGNLFTLLVILKLVTPKHEYHILKLTIAELKSHFTPQIHSVPFKDIIDQMGFPPNWKSLI